MACRYRPVKDWLHHKHKPFRIIQCHKEPPASTDQEEAVFLSRLGYAVLLRFLKIGAHRDTYNQYVKRMRKALGLKPE